MSSSSVFSALRHRDFRLFWTGQMVSLLGTWMQNVGQSWLVLTLTDSAFLLGLVSAAQFLPVLFVSLFAGVLIDRSSKRNLLLITQGSLLILALTLGVLVSTGAVRYWHVLALATVLGVVNAVDMPVRQSYVVELVGGREDLMNAIALNSAIFNGARIVGPGIAGLTMGYWGPAAMFYLNAASFLAVIAGLSRIRPQVPTAVAQGRLLTHLGEGLGYVRRSRLVGGSLLLLGLLSTFAQNFNVVVPVYARSVLGQSAKGYGFLMSGLGLGALVGSIALARRSRTGPSRPLMLVAGVTLGLSQLLLSGVKSFLPALGLLALGGWSMMTFNASVNSTVQLAVPDSLRGRVMSVYTLVLAGFTPFGSMFAGSLSSRWGVGVAIWAGGLIGLCSSFAATVVYLSSRRRGEAGPDGA